MSEIIERIVVALLVIVVTVMSISIVLSLVGLTFMATGWVLLGVRSVWSMIF